MNTEETLKVCRLAKALSPAQAVDEYQPEAWHLVLRHWRYADATTALEQLGGEQEWIHVSHIVRRIRKMRRDRVLEFGTLPDPPTSLDPADTEAYSRWLRTTTQAIADGTYEAPAPEAIEGPRRDVLELGQAGTTVDAALAARPLREAHAEAKRVLQEADAARKRKRADKQARLEQMRADDRAARAALTVPVSRPAPVHPTPEESK